MKSSRLGQKNSVCLPIPPDDSASEVTVSSGCRHRVRKGGFEFKLSPRVCHLPGRAARRLSQRDDGQLQVAGRRLGQAGRGRQRLQRRRAARRILRRLRWVVKERLVPARTAGSTPQTFCVRQRQSIWQHLCQNRQSGSLTEAVPEQRLGCFRQFSCHMAVDCAELSTHNTDTATPVL